MIHRPMNIHHPRPGFSLIELIVVIAIIGALLALGLPAIQQMRQSARATECKNKIRQVVIGLQNHQTQFGYLPKNGVQGWGYAVFLLPQVEQAPLYQQLNPNQASMSSMPGLTDTILQVYLCPSFQKNPIVSTGFGRLNYLGNSTLINSQKMQFADVTDGESLTVAVGETTSDYAWAKSGTASGGSGPNQGTFGSQHGPGANFGMCDGAVRFINNQVDSGTFQAMFTISATDKVGDF